MESTSLINLESLLELSARLNESNDEEFILNSTLLTLMGKLRTVRACVLLTNVEQSTFEIALAKGRTALTEIDYFQLKELRELMADSPAERQLIDAGYVYVMPLCYHQSLLAGIYASASYFLQR